MPSLVYTGMNNLRPLPLLFRIVLNTQRRGHRPFATRPCAHRWIKHRRGKYGEDNEDGGAAVTRDGGRIRFHKSRGQHILTNPRALDAIVRKAHVLPGDTVLEIRPGTGNLTLRLLQASRRVVAVEIDPRMVEVLCRRASEEGVGDRLQVISGDALKVEFPHPTSAWPIFRMGYRLPWWRRSCLMAVHPAFASGAPRFSSRRNLLGASPPGG